MTALQLAAAVGAGFGSSVVFVGLAFWFLRRWVSRVDSVLEVWSSIHEQVVVHERRITELEHDHGTDHDKLESLIAKCEVRHA
jgi:hypothetical protein